MTKNQVGKSSAANLRGARGEERDMVIRSCPPFFYAWPLVALGYLLSGLDFFGLVDASGVTSPIYYSVTIVVLITIGIPLSLWQCCFFLLLVLLGCLNIAFVSELLSVLLYQGGSVDLHFAVGLSNTLAAVYLLMLGYLGVNYFRISSASIVEHSFGRREVATTRAGKQLRAEFPSFLKAIVGCGAGDLVVRDTNGNRELLRIADVPGLYFRFRLIERRLKTSPVIEEEDDDIA